MGSPGEAVAAVITRRAMVTRTSLTLLLLVLGLGHSTARYYSQFFGDHLPPDNPRQVYGSYSGDMEAAGQNMEYEDSGAAAPVISREMLAPRRRASPRSFPDKTSRR